MALKYLTNLNINDNVLQNARVFATGTAPTELIGALYVDTADSNKLKYHNGTEYVALGSATGDIQGVTAGDGLSGGGTSGTVRLDIEAAQTVITSIFATDLKLGEDDETKIDFETPDEIHFYAANVEQVYLGDNIFGPQSDSDVDLGSNTVRWKDAYVDSITVTGEVDGGSLDISGNADIDGTTNLDDVDIDGNVQLDGTFTVGANDTGYDVKFFGATASAYMQWDESEDDLILGGAARIVVPDGQLVLNSTAVTSTAAELNLLDGSSANTVVNGKGVIYGSSGEIKASSLSVEDGDITNVGDIALDSISADGTDINISLTDDSATAFTIKQGSDAYLIVDTGDSSESVSIGTGISGTAITIGHSTSETTVADNLTVTGNSTFSGNATVTGNLTVNGTTTTVNTATLSVEDPLIKLASGNNAADSVDIGFYGLYDTSGSQDLYAGLFRDAGDDKFRLFKSLQAEPTTTVDTTGTGYTVATLVANIEGNVTGNISGDITGTLQTAAQPNITSLGTLTALTVDNVNIDGKVITMTGSSGDTATLTVGTNGTLDIVTTDAAAANANIQITADGTAELAGTTVTLDSSGGITLDADGGTITFADNGSSLGTITSSGYSGTSAVATTVTITDNEDTNENNAIIFAAGGDVDGGNLGLESDGDLTYNPSTGTVTATTFAGNLSGNAATVTTNANLSGDVTSSGNTTTISSGAVEAGMLAAPIKGCSVVLNSSTTGIARGVSGSSAPYTTTFTIQTNNDNSANNLTELSGADSRKLMVEVLDGTTYATVMADVTRNSNGKEFSIAFLTQASGGVSNSTFRFLARQVG